MALESRAPSRARVAIIFRRRQAQVLQEHWRRGGHNRSQFSHWGVMPSTEDAKALRRVGEGRPRVGKAIWAGWRAREPQARLRAPGRIDAATSVFVCGPAAWSSSAPAHGYNRDGSSGKSQWMRQKRFQGSHLSTTSRRPPVTKLVSDGKVDPCLSRTYVLRRHPRVATS